MLIRKPVRVTRGGAYVIPSADVMRRARHIAIDAGKPLHVVLAELIEVGVTEVERRAT